MNSFTSRLLSNPDDVSVFQELRLLSGNQWFLDLSSDKVLDLLGINGCYSEDVNVIRKSILSVSAPYCKSATFPNSDDSLCQFLLNSLNKQDVLKPYSQTNCRKLPIRKLLRIDNATCICSPLSIAILDSNSKIVKEASHNASESLYLWWLNASSTFRCEELDTVLFASVQQTFNLGHWFIDSLSRLAYAQPFLKSVDNLTVLIDTKDHIIIKDTLSHFGFSSVKPTLPYSVFKVKTLYVPVLESFSDRVHISAELVNDIYPIDKSLPDSSLRLKNPDRIYLSRQKLDRRIITNHNDMDSLLNYFNFSDIHPQELDLFTMNRLIKEAEIVFGPNGAAMCNILFGKDQPKRIGIIYPTSHLDDYYFLVSNSLSYDFYGSFSDVPNIDWKSIDDMITSYYYPSVSGDYTVDSSYIYNMLTSITS